MNTKRRKSVQGDPKLPHGSKFCLCSGCGEYFTNEKNFSMHRRGEPSARYCVHPSKLLTKTGKAYLRLNAAGYWARPGRFGGPK